MNIINVLLRFFSHSLFLSLQGSKVSVWIIVYLGKFLSTEGRKNYEKKTISIGLLRILKQRSPSSVRTVRANYVQEH